jgi:hypothetical protein
MEPCIPTIVSIALGVLWLLFSFVADNYYTSVVTLMPQTASDWLAYGLITTTIHILVQVLCARGKMGLAWALGLFPVAFGVSLFVTYNLWMLKVTTDASGNIFVE